jgi:hypothetical protein
LVQAVNSHDKEAVLSFIHPTFVGKTKGGWSIAGYKRVVCMLKHLCAPGSDYQETVAIEDIEVKGDSARLVVRRVARVRSHSQEDRVQETWRLIDGRWLLVEERRLDAMLKTRPILVALAIVAAVGAFVAFSFWSESTAWHGTEFQRSGNPALKLEVRQGSIEEVEGWKPATLKDPIKDTYYVSPEVELSNDGVASTGVLFNPHGGPKKQSRWLWGVVFLVLSGFVLVNWRRSKQWQEAALGAFFLLLGLGCLAWAFFPVPVDESAGTWQVVIRLKDAGKNKVDRVFAEVANGQSKPSYPKKYLVFLVDGELTFRVAIWAPNTEGLYYLYAGLSKDEATRIAKGIIGP